MALKNSTGYSSISRSSDTFVVILSEDLDTLSPGESLLPQLLIADT